MTTVSVPGRPFGIASTLDGCWLFVSLTDTPRAGGAIAVLRNEHGDFGLDHVVKAPGEPTGMSLAENGQLLAVPAGDRILLLEVAKLESRDQQPVIADIDEGGKAGAIEAQFALKDHLLFVSEEHTSRIGVIDVQRAEQGDSARSFIGRAPAGGGPVGLALSSDGLRLFVASQVASASPTSANRCASPQPGGKTRPEGMLLSIDVRAAAKDPQGSVRTAWAAGCSPVRVAISADGTKAWVTAREDGALLQFSMSEFFGILSTTGIVRHNVGAAPVGLAVRPDGREVWVANSGRFAASGSGTLTCISLADGSQRQVSSGRFPRELIFLPDGKTLVASVFGSSAVQFVPTAIPGRAGTCGAAA